MKAATSDGRTRLDRLRWRFWSWLCGWPRICNSNAYTLVIYGDRCNPFIDSLCHRDLAESGDGHCWCGKLQAGERMGPWPPTTSTDSKSATSAAGPAKTPAANTATAGATSGQRCAPSARSPWGTSDASGSEPGDPTGTRRNESSDSSPSTGSAGCSAGSSSETPDGG